MKRYVPLLCVYLLLMCTDMLRAQQAIDPVSYSHLIHQFSVMNMNGDPQSEVLPSVAVANGFGSFIDNPAAIAMIKGSYLNLGLNNHRVSETNNYLGNSSDVLFKGSHISNLGAIFKFPTSQGALVLGGGYNLMNDLDRSTEVYGRNNESSITDEFKNPESDYNELAFETYAIDYGDVEQTYLESIFRIGFPVGTFPGITQNITSKTNLSMAEYSAFLATEFLKNLYGGLSIGLTSGSYSYRRNFLELDEYNNYDGDFIPSDDPNMGTDVEAISVRDEIESEISGITVRGGIIYKFGNQYSIGASFTAPSEMSIQETYYYSIETTLDDGSTPFFYDLSGDFEYKITRPAQYKIGFGYTGYGGLTISSSAEWIDYSKTTINYDLDKFNPITSFELNILENEIDSTTQADYNQVLNLKAGLKYLINNKIEVRGGYAYLPATSNKSGSDRMTYSLGLGMRITEGMVLDLSGTFQTWDDQFEAYNYYDFNGSLKSETISNKIDSFRLQVGIKFLF